MVRKLKGLKILVTRDIPQKGLELLRKEGCLLDERSSANPLSAKEFFEVSQNADVVLSTSKDKVTRAYLLGNPHLLMISQFAAGFDNIDVAAATELGFPLGHTPQAMNKATSDIAFGLMIATARNFFQMHKRLINEEIKDFRPRADLGLEMYGKTIGIFGLGAIGFEMARKCKMAYGMKVIYCNRSRNIKAEDELQAEKVSLEELLKLSDVLSVHSNLTPETHKIFNKEAFSQMKSTAIFINTSRGSVHDEEALIYALKEKQIWGAGLDVTDPEPMSSKNPLLEMNNVCVLPHIGSATVEARDEMSRLSAENIIQYFKTGKMVHCINPEVLN